MLVDCPDDGRQENEELGIVIGRFSGLQQVMAGVGPEGPIVMLAGAVDAGERLLSQEAGESLPLCHPLHHIHNNLILIAGDVGRPVKRGHLMLAGGRFVVLGLRDNADLPKLDVELIHEGSHPLGDGAAIVPLILLPFEGVRTHQGFARQFQVGARIGHLFVDKEIFLFGADIGAYSLGLSVTEQA
ncbi:hypothetical protein SDC9_187657 [bioreactor metagenome]|uniref:Uncharacterized protein n=1 Tax=bioreactor metagenome TaxID=1076179 RepID=A0A645HM55_9ZZZZ